MTSSSGPLALTPTTYRLELYPEGAQTGQPAQVRLEEVDADTWRVWIRYQGQTYAAPATPLQGGRTLFSAYPLLPVGATSTPPRSGAVQRLTQQDPAPVAPSSGEGYQPGVPAMMLVRLESGGGQAIVTLRDARERIIGQGVGVVDWSGEADHLAQRLDEARKELERTDPLDRTRRQELRVEELAEQHRRLSEQVTRDEIESGDPIQVEAASERARDRLAELRERYLALEDPQGAEGQALSEELRSAEDLLQHARRARARLDAAELESRDLERVSRAAERARERLARLREASVAEADPRGPRGQLLREEMDDAQRLLEHAVQLRTQAEAAELESRDLERVSEGVDHVRERLARLREEFVQIDARTPRTELLSEDMRRSEELLRHGLQQRTRLEAAEVESGSPRRTAAVAERIRARLAALREDYTRVEAKGPRAALLSQDMQQTARLLEHALEQRTRAEAAGIESTSPRTVARATAQVQGRLARLREDYAQAASNSPTAQFLAQDMRRSEELLRHALQRRQTVEAQALESGDPARMEPVVSELEARLNSAEVRLAQLPGFSSTHELLREERERTSRLLRVAHERQLTRDEQDARSLNPARVAALKERLEARIAHLDDLAKRWRPSGGEQGPPAWLIDQRQASRDLLRRVD